MRLIDSLIGYLENSIKPETNGYVDLSTLTSEERKDAFVQFGEGNADLTRLLNVAYEHGVESMFCCSGHEGPYGYVLFKVNEENLEYLQNVGKVLSKYNVATNFENHYQFGTRVSFYGIGSSDWFGIAADVMENIKDFDLTNPSLYYHEEMDDSYVPLSYRVKKGIIEILKRIGHKNECLPEPRVETANNSKKEFVESLRIEPEELVEGEVIYKNNNVMDNNKEIEEI